jgi:hypothetical protein
MAANLTVRYWTSEIEKNLQSYDLRISIEAATDMPREIFVLHRGLGPSVEGDDTATDAFQCIADPVDIEEFPTGSPDLANEMPYYRVSEITLRFRCMLRLEEVRELIDEDLAALVRALKAADSLPVYEEVAHG